MQHAAFKFVGSLVRSFSVLPFANLEVPALFPELNPPSNDPHVCPDCGAIYASLQKMAVHRNRRHNYTHPLHAFVCFAKGGFTLPNTPSTKGSRKPRVPAGSIFVENYGFDFEIVISRAGEVTIWWKIPFWKAETLRNSVSKELAPEDASISR